MRFFWLVMCGESFSDEFYFGQGGFSFGQGGVGRVDRGSMPGTAFHPAPQPTTGSKKTTTMDPSFQRNFLAELERNFCDASSHFHGLAISLHENNQRSLRCYISRNSGIFRLRRKINVFETISTILVFFLKMSGCCKDHLRIRRRR